MKIRLRLGDTIARRFAITIVLAVASAVALNGLFEEFAGVWGRPSAVGLGLLDQADDIVRIVEAAPASVRQSLANAVSGPTFRVDWYPPNSTVTVMLDAVSSLKTVRNLPQLRSGDGLRRMALFDADEPPPATMPLPATGHPNAHSLSVELADQSWVMFTVYNRLWGFRTPTRVGIGLAFLTVSILLVTAVATYQLSRPIKAFTAALQRFGTDRRAAPIPETGPRELQAAIFAFNAMQAQVQRFVEDRTTMLAAISHDLRTPLTRIRLRGEFVEDPEQQARLFRDVDDMQAMVDSALSFFRDDLHDEEATTFDFPEMLRTIADDYSDQGTEVGYQGPDHAAFHGRPFALKRAFGNLIDNAVKYGSGPEVELRHSPTTMCVILRDRGPGIPPEAAERVFAPFYRLERSRNRTTGGVGLGLTSAQAVIHGHGGYITLQNRQSGGLRVQVILPVVRLQSLR